MSSGNLQKLRPLRPQGVIGVIATGGPSSRERFELGVSTIQKLGYHVRSPFDPWDFYGKHDHGFASQSAEVRARAMCDLLEDPEVDAILAVRGAYASIEILPLLPLAKIQAAKKAVIGSSDITALLAMVYGQTGMPSIHGATLASCFADYETDSGARESVDALLSMLTDVNYRWKEPVKMLRAGDGAGPLLVGNLTMLTSLLGTPWDVDYTDSVLVIEDVGEAPFRIHRAMNQLRFAGKLAKLRALVFARFVRCESKFGPTVDEVFELVVRDVLFDTSYPVAKGLSVGHYGKNLPLALGCKAELVQGEFRVLESPIG